MSSIINCCFHLLLLPLWRFNPPLMQTPAFANYMLDLLVLQTTTSANHVFLTTSANYYGHISVSPSANDIVTFYKRLLLLLLTSRLSYSYNQLLLLQPYCLILLLLSSDTQFWLKFVIESYQNYLRFFVPIQMSPRKSLWNVFLENSKIFNGLLDIESSPVY